MSSRYPQILAPVLARELNGAPSGDPTPRPSLSLTQTGFCPQGTTPGRPLLQARKSLPG